jgi:hypothetical protein
VVVRGGVCGSQPRHGPCSAFAAILVLHSVAAEVDTLPGNEHMSPLVPGCRVLLSAMSAWVLPVVRLLHLSFHNSPQLVAGPGVATSCRPTCWVCTALAWQLILCNACGQGPLGLHTEVAQHVPATVL